MTGAMTAFVEVLQIDNFLPCDKVFTDANYFFITFFYSCQATKEDNGGHRQLRGWGDTDQHHQTVCKTNARVLNNHSGSAVSKEMQVGGEGQRG